MNSNSSMGCRANKSLPLVTDQIADKGSLFGGWQISELTNLLLNTGCEDARVAHKLGYKTILAPTPPRHATSSESLQLEQTLIKRQC